MIKYRSKCVWKSANQRIREVLIAKYVPNFLFHASPYILTENIMKKKCGTVKGHSNLNILQV